MDTNVRSENIKEIIHTVATTAREKGWWEKDRSLAEVIALTHSELSEALEHYRNGHRIDRVWREGDKPDGVLVELADVLIRIFDYVGNRNLSDEFVDALHAKIAYNTTRPYRHGNKQL
jgi:hypothetical protein